MEAAEHQHASWCIGEPDETDEHRSHMVVVHPDTFDDATVRAWLVRLSGSTTGSALVMIEVEDLEMRARRALTAGLTRAFIDILVELRRFRRAGERRATTDGHPAWCARLEKPGAPHRSRVLEATEKHNGDVIQACLVRGTSPESPAPMAFIEMRTDGVLLEWPPLTMLQHHALPRRLTYLLDQLHQAESEALALPRST